jgi:hypothetical protein
MELLLLIIMQDAGARMSNSPTRKQAGHVTCIGPRYAVTA